MDDVYNQRSETIQVSREPAFSLKSWSGRGRRRQVNLKIDLERNGRKLLGLGSNLSDCMALLLV